MLLWKAVGVVQVGCSGKRGSDSCFPWVLLCYLPPLTAKVLGGRREEISSPEFRHFINQPQPRFYQTKPYVWYWPVVVPLCHQPIIFPSCDAPFAVLPQSLVQLCHELDLEMDELRKCKSGWQCFSWNHSQIQKIVFWGTLCSKWREWFLHGAPFITEGTGWKLTGVKVPYRMTFLEEP